MDKVLLLVNTGTPDDPGIESVKRYLTEFLNDPMVMDMPPVIRNILVNRIIIPARVSHSSKLYNKLWTPEGSPLRFILDSVVKKLNDLNNGWEVIGAMRYGNPGITDALSHIKNSVNQLTVLPLYPQFTSSTTGTVINLITENIKSWNKKPSLRFIDQFYNDEDFISSFAAIMSKHDVNSFDHVVFSYHSLPLKHLRKIHPNMDPATCTCNVKMTEYEYCYKASCYETTRLLSAKLDLQPETFTTSFQSRLFGKWAGPFTDDILKNLLKEGKKRVLVAAPSFTIDCLETLVEIDIDYKQMFLDGGGELEMSESLNDDDQWIRSIAKIVSRHQE